MSAAILADRFLSELYSPDLAPQIRRLPFVIAATQWAAALSSGDEDRIRVHAQRLDREVDDFVGIGQVERLRRQLRFE